MKVIDAEKLRDLFYWGKNDKCIINPEIDAIMLEIIDSCTVEIDTQDKPE